MSRKHWLLIAAVVVSTAAAQAACSTDQPLLTQSHRSRALTTVRAEELDQDLPGCLEALSSNDDSARRWENVDLARLSNAPGLGVLVVDGRQMCVDRLDELETWMETGSWPQLDMKQDVRGSDEIIPQDRGDVAHERVKGWSTDQNANDDQSDGEPHERSLDDSNPLPPYPNPMHLQ